MDRFDDGMDTLITGVAADGSPFPVRKREAHVTNIPHQAVSIFLIRNGALLMQQRASGKYHAPLLWANTACSHPLWQETAADCARRTLRKELGLDVSVTQFATTHYETAVGALYENEHVVCFCGTPPTRICEQDIASNEVAQVRAMTIEALTRMATNEPEQIAPWFLIYLESGVVARAFDAVARN